jgi:putative sigma-54 modulation protein
MEAQMKIQLRHSNVQISEALADHVDRKIGLAVRRFQERIAALAVRLIDENGPRGGLDTRCSVVVELIGGGRVVVKALATDAYASVTRAAALLHAQVTRVIARRKR